MYIKYTNSRGNEIINKKGNKEEKEGKQNRLDRKETGRWQVE
jgi:arginyl-tRNA synthetase